MSEHRFGQPQSRQIPNERPEAIGQLLLEVIPFRAVSAPPVGEHDRQAILWAIALDLQLRPVGALQAMHLAGTYMLGVVAASIRSAEDARGP
jgi:hypothetical protein